MKILLIDDQLEVRDIMSMILEEEIGAEVFSCSNALEAAKYLTEETIKLIICDYNLPKQNGLEFFENVVNDGLSDIPFLLITGMSFDDDDERILKFKSYKNNKLILKPFDEDVLLEEINALFDN